MLLGTELFPVLLILGEHALVFVFQLVLHDHVQVLKTSQLDVLLHDFLLQTHDFFVLLVREGVYVASVHVGGGMGQLIEIFLDLLFAVVGELVEEAGGGQPGILGGRDVVRGLELQFLLVGMAVMGHWYYKIII